MTCLEIWRTPQALEKYTARARHVAKLRADLDSSRAVLRAELKEAPLNALFEQHLALQEALITELLHPVSGDAVRRLSRTDGSNSLPCETGETSGRP